MAEGVAQDISSGHLSHCLDERGFNAECKYNRKAVVTRAAIGVVAIGAIALLLTSKKINLSAAPISPPSKNYEKLIGFKFNIATSRSAGVVLYF